MSKNHKSNGKSGKSGKSVKNVKVTVKGFAYQHECDPIIANNVLMFLVKKGVGSVVDKLKKEKVRGKPANIFEMPSEVSFNIKEMIATPEVPKVVATAAPTAQTDPATDAATDPANAPADAAPAQTAAVETEPTAEVQPEATAQTAAPAETTLADPVNDEPDHAPTAEATDPVQNDTTETTDQTVPELNG